MHRLKPIVSLSFVFCLVFIVSSCSVSAADSNISRSYKSIGSIPNGSIVGLNKNQAGYVRMCNSVNNLTPIGVSLSSSESLLAINPNLNNVQVATSGVVNVLASTVNGNIHIGDQISLSPFYGIGMEFQPGIKTIGTAESAFNKTSTDAALESVKDNQGKVHQIYVGFVKIEIGIGNGTENGAGGNQANLLQQIVKDLTGHTISTVRIIIALVVSLIALVSLVTIIYASVYGTLVSVGRNPLAKNAIFRTLGSIMIMSSITVVVACLTIYFLLR